jgi:hypothetical protein
MEAATAESQSLSAAMGECQSQMDKLGQCMGKSPGQGMGECFGEGAQSQFAEGDSTKQGSGQGGPGRGQGGAMDDEATDFALEQVKQQVANRGGPIISETVVFGSQVRGESRADFQAAVSEARAVSTEALESKAVPRQYSEAIQHYFGRLEAVAKGTSTPAEEKADEKKDE